MKRDTQYMSIVLASLCFWTIIIFIIITIKIIGQPPSTTTNLSKLEYKGIYL